MASWLSPSEFSQPPCELTSYHLRRQRGNSESVVQLQGQRSSSRRRYCWVCLESKAFQLDDRNQHGAAAGRGFIWTARSSCWEGLHLKTQRPHCTIGVVFFSLPHNFDDTGWYKVGSDPKDVLPSFAFCRSSSVRCWLRTCYRCRKTTPWCPPIQ